MKTLLIIIWFALLSGCVSMEYTDNEMERRIAAVELIKLEDSLRSIEVYMNVNKGKLSIEDVELLIAKHDDIKAKIDTCYIKHGSLFSEKLAMPGRSGGYSGGGYESSSHADIPISKPSYITPMLNGGWMIW